MDFREWGYKFDWLLEGVEDAMGYFPQQKVQIGCLNLQEVEEIRNEKPGSLDD